MAATKITGKDDLFRVFDDLGKGKGLAVIRQGLYVAGQEVLTDSQRRLTSQGQRVTGKLFRSGKVSKIPSQMEVDISYDSNYAFYAEFGRKAGTPPPYAPIMEWVKKKGIADTYSIKTKRRSKRTSQTLDRIKGMSIAIAKNIGKKGTKGKPYLYPAFEAKKGNVYRNIATLYNEFINTIRVK